MKIAISDIASLVQIAFYITGSTVAVLTYKSAKKGLLNTVNTEYQKRVMDRLEALSSVLYSEFDPESDEYWLNREGKITVIDIVNKDLEDYRKFQERNMSLEPEEKYKAGILVVSIEEKLTKLIQDIKSDPFLPDEIANHVVEKLTFRRDTVNIIMDEEIDAYRQKLFRHEFTEPEMLPYFISNKINTRMYEAGCGISQVEEDVHNIRILIREYLKSFNPLKK
ncbi:hypothetical protein QRY07_19050 [Bacillus cereus]|uniref:hypothetical protein n=1 Tax=Bacillus cereus TaxID=1396 RepID=UPI0025711A21|nr:hypothetical protein [Bacillus cereus]WJE18831.1 hypothetical protein QRY07_19050 [Bacillus cereus]